MLIDGLCNIADQMISSVTAIKSENIPPLRLHILLSSTSKLSTASLTYLVQNAAAQRFDYNSGDSCR